MDNTVILMSDHLRIIRRLKQKMIWVFSIGILLVAMLCLGGWLYDLERKIIISSYETIKNERNLIILKHELLQTLRKRPITIGVAIDIMDAVTSQKKIPVPIILAILEQESQFDPRAVSTQGARGQGQLMDATWRHYGNGTNIHDSLSNISASIAYLSDLQRTYKDNWMVILRAYNGGSSNANNKALDGYARVVLAKAKIYEAKIGR